MKMTNRWQKDLTLFCGSVAIGAWTFFPSRAGAVPAWRQYSAVGCEFQGKPHPDFANGTMRAGFSDGLIFNNIVAPQQVNPFPDEDKLRLLCPIVEDESVHSKGGTQVHVTLESYPNNWSTFLFVCARFDSAIGLSCSPQVSVSGQGVQSFTVTPTASVWQTGTNFGYLYIGLGSKTPSGTLANKLIGYRVSHT
jgi:hypothetical protein